MLIKIESSQSFLGSPRLALKYRTQMELALIKYGKVTLDFCNVFATAGFVSKLLEKIVTENGLKALGNRINFINVTQDTKQIIAVAVNNFNLRYKQYSGSGK